MTLFGALGYLTGGALMALGTFVHCLAGIGMFCWTITQSVFVFRHQGVACSYQTGATTDYEQAWAQEWIF